MHRTIHRSLLVAAAALLLAGAARADQTAPITRAQVRAELAEARALGLMGHDGEAGVSDDVVLARDLDNATRARVLIARRELALREQAAVPGPQQQAYVEAGRAGPVLVLFDTAADGTVRCVEGPLDQVAIDYD